MGAGYSVGIVVVVYVQHELGSAHHGEMPSCCSVCECMREELSLGFTLRQRQHTTYHISL